MRKITFKKFWEIANFGFNSDHAKDEPEDTEIEPIRRFDLELMMNYLLRKKVGLHEANYSGFMNEITWGENLGAIKVEVDTGLTVYIKKLNHDVSGNKRWITKQMYQINRLGMHGFEDMVANEIYDNVQRVNKIPLDRPIREYDELEKLTWHVSRTIQKTMKPVFIWRGIKKLDECLYQIILECRGGGVGSSAGNRLEHNVTQLAFDDQDGTIRVTNYIIESQVGGDRSWTMQPLDLDLYFFPSQTKEEIGDCVAVHFKYY